MKKLKRPITGTCTMSCSQDADFETFSIYWTCFKLDNYRTLLTLQQRQPFEVWGSKNKNNLHPHVK